MQASSLPNKLLNLLGKIIVTALKTLTSSLEGVFKQIEDGLNAYAEATSKYMADLDRHSAKIVGLLGGAVTDLGDHFQDFSDALTAQRQ